MIWLLILLLAAIILGGARAALRPGGVEVNHVVLFSFGLLFYWVLPVAAGALGILSDEPALSLWYATWYAAARSGAVTGFLAFTLVTYCAFLAGDWVGARIRLGTWKVGPPRDTGPRAGALRENGQHASSGELPRDPRLLRLFLLPALAGTLLYAWLLRDQLGAGYRIEFGAERGLQGTLSAFSLVLLALCLLRASESSRWPRAHRGWLGLATDPFLIAYAGAALLVLSLGGRLYVVSAIIMGLVYHTVHHRPLPFLRTTAIAIAAMLLAGIAGTIRLGYAPTPLGVAVNVLAEPLFTSFSLLHFLAEGNIPWITTPRFLLGDFLNIVPSAILPTKGQYLLDPTDFGYSIFSPLGALNSFVSFVINFGLVGTPVVIFLLGATLAVLRRRGTTLSRVIYAMLAGWLAFTFFRDAFSISVVKNMFQFAVLMPTLIVWAMHVMTVIAPRRRTSTIALASAR